MNYRLAYWLGFHPWEDAATDAPFAAKISEIFDREESGREPPYGPALDIGTGSGIWGVELAKRGWQVTGVDIVGKAMGRGVTAVTSPDATVLLLVWPKRRRPLIRGARREDVEEAFPDWTITHVEPSQFRLPKPLQLLLRPDEHWYRLRRASA